MAGGLAIALECSRVPCGNSSHEIRQRVVADLHERVQVVCHPAVRMNARSVFGERVLDDRVQKQSVRLGSEDGFAVIATERYVVEAARKMQS
jgi:hypothetical protein